MSSSGIINRTQPKRRLRSLFVASQMASLSKQSCSALRRDRQRQHPQHHRRNTETNRLSYKSPEFALPRCQTLLARRGARFGSTLIILALVTYSISPSMEYLRPLPFCPETVIITLSKRGACVIAGSKDSVCRFRTAISAIRMKPRNANMGMPRSARANIVRSVTVRPAAFTWGVCAGAGAIQGASTARWSAGTVRTRTATAIGTRTTGTG